MNYYINNYGGCESTLNNILVYLLSSRIEMGENEDLNSDGEYREYAHQNSH